ncbi:hypothetical protein J4406_00230, partial [Candidatus Woesearchaeota archaeon]|nr:hypothetical protein [Candidatus Woesearchaeota archaeon]
TTFQQWHMYTVIFDSTYGAFLYRDGIEIGNDLTVGYVTTAQANFNIGKIGTAAVGLRNWTGAIDELHIWNGTLNANEINNLYLNGLNQVKMQTRLGNNLTSQTKWGEWGNTTSIGINATYANSTGENINYTYNGSNNRYIQYRAFLETIDANYTPSLYDVVMKQVDYKVRIFNYEPLSNFSLSYPGNNTWINNNHTSLNWTNQSDLDNDDLYSWLQVYNITDSLIINVSLYNKTELPFGVGVHESLYGLNFGWNGRSKDDYVNDLTGTLNGGVGVGDSQSLFPDNNATTFDGMDDYIYYSLSMNNGTTYSAWFNYQHKTGFESYSGKNCVLDTGQIEMCISKEGKLEVSGVNITAQNWDNRGQLGTNTFVRSLTVWNGSLYGGSGSGSDSGIVYRYSGSSWIDTGQLGTDDNVLALTVWNGSLYGGTISSGNVYRYSGSSWIDTGQLGTNVRVYSLAVWNGSLYGGTYISGKVYRYSGSSWIDTGQLGTSTFIHSLAVWNGSLYGGSGSDSGKVYRYNETGWIYTGQLGTNVRVYSLAVWNGSLYGGTSVSGNVYRYGDSGLTLTNEINNEWNHAAVTLDGNNMYLYLNGQLVQQGTYKQYVPVSSINVGTRAGSSGAGLNGELFNGTLDEVHIWNRSLNADEVSLLYYSGIGLMDGNYTWRVRTIDNSTINDNNYESAYSDWSDYFEFYLDSQAPTAAVHNITINRTIGEVIVNESSPVVTGENITLRFNITDAGFGVNSAWIKIWQTVKDGIMLFFGWLIHVTGDIWEITLPAVNYTYAPGQVNYTIYANDTINNTVEYDDSFYVEYNTTLDSFFNYYTVEYGDNVTIIINYNYTNSSAIMGSFVNATISNVLYTATYDSRGFYYNDTIGYYDINLGNYVVSVNASRNSQYYTFRNNLTHLAVQDTIAPNLTNANATLLGFSGNSIAPWNITKINVTAQDRHSINKSIVQVNTPGFNYFNISMIKNGNEYYTEYNLSSNVTEAGTFTFFFLFNDNSSNWNNTVNYSVYVNDSTFPTIDNVNKTPEPSYLSSNVTLNATIYDMFLYEVWLEGNWSGSWVNYTNSSGAFYINSNTYYYNISFGNFSHRQNVAYRWWANDTLGNTNVSSWQEFYVNNRAPTIAVWRYPTMNTHMLYDNFTIFDWDNSTDYDLDNMSYELELYNNTAFNSTYLIFAFNSSFSNYTLLAASMPPVGDYYIRYRANDSLIYNEYNYTNFSVVYAILQIVSPSYDQILKVGSSYFFNVTESGNGDWVSNVSLEIKGATFTNYINLTNYTAQFDYTSYNATYAVPSVVSQYVDIIAYSWNGSIGSSTNNSDTSRFRIPNAITGVPQIDYFCPGRTYVTQEQVNITVRTQMNDVLVELVNASIVSPGGDTVILNSTSSNINNYINNDYNFEYNFTYTPIAEGEHQLRIEVRDVNFNDTGATANKTIPLIVSNITNISFTSNGISNFTIKDICSNEIIIYSNASVSISEVPGVYNLEFIQDKLTVLVSNATLDGNEGEICDYDDISETLSVPTDTRAVDQINVSCYNLNYGWSNNNASVNMTYNYTNILQRITHEENLDAYKCYSIESCTWSQLTSSSVTSDQNKIEFATNNFSVFMVAEDVTVTTVTVSAPGSGGGGGGGGGGSDQGVDLDIIEPGVLEIGEGSVFTTTVILKNPWTQPLYGIQLSAVSSEENLEFSFDTNYILELLPGAQMSVILTVKKIGDILGEDFDINVIANVASPDFIDSSKIAITSFGEGIKTQSARQIDFVERLFVQNPACKELYELVKKSKASFDKGDYETAIKLSEGAVNSCESLLTSLGLKIQKPKGKILTDNVIIGIEILVFLFVFYGLYYYYRRRRFKNKKI